MKNTGIWIPFSHEIMNQLDDKEFYDIKLDNGEVRLATFDKRLGHFKSNRIDGPVYVRTESHIIEIRKSFSTDKKSDINN